MYIVVFTKTIPRNVLLYIAYSMEEILKHTLPWCVWTKLAIDFVMVLKYLDESPLGPAVHCDWKANQFVCNILMYVNLNLLKV
jgi:hypothetical protein